MPTVLREDGFSVRIYFNDHSPPHVHIFKAGQEAKINIEEEIPYLLSTDSMTLSNIRKSLSLVKKHQVRLMEAWQEIHG